MPFFLACFAILLGTAVANAATFNINGALSYHRDSGLTLEGTIDADASDIRLRQRTPYRASARLTLPQGISVTVPIITPIGPSEIETTFLENAGSGVTLFQGSTVTPPFRVGRLLRAPILPGDISIGGAFLFAFDALSDTPRRGIYASEIGDPADPAPGPFGLLNFSWDFSDVDVSGPERTIMGSFVINGDNDSIDINGQSQPLSSLVDEIFMEFADEFGLPGAQFFTGLNKAAAPYELALTLTPVPVPAALPLLMSGIALLAVMRRRTA
jgi:hypothetical protein